MMILKLGIGSRWRISRLVVVALISLLLGALGLLLIRPGALQAQGSPIAINEFMASNTLTLADEDGDFSDWIELYNTGATPVSLAGYQLADSGAQWTFPDVEIAAHAYLLVWASDKNRAVAGQPLHTNFKISTGGERITLTTQLGVTADTAGPIGLMDDISYGRQPDGAGDWFFFAEGTPGDSNVPQAYTGFLTPPTFSQAGGFFTQPFSLTLSHSTPGAAIIYTLDGSVPDPDNVNGKTYTYKNQYPQAPSDPFGAILTDTYRTYTYTQPLAIADRSAAVEKNTDKSSTYDFTPTYFPTSTFKGTIVRARAIMSGSLPSHVSTHSFFVTPEGRARYSLPVISLSMDEDTLFGYTLGIYTAGEDFDAWRTANPGVTATPDSDANWHRDSEFPGHLDLFETGSSALSFSQDMGFHGHGDFSRMRRMKTLRLYARAEYGDDNFTYRLFPDRSYTNYKRVLLRNSGNDFNYTMFRDAAIQTSVAHLGFDTQAYRPTIVFLNGEYWGIHNLRERYDQYYLAQRYGTDPDNIDLLENQGLVSEGDAAHYEAMLDYIETNGVTDTVDYENIKTQMDVENYRDYQITEIFIGNTDWPQNNIKYWRMETPYNPTAPYGQDGRWRWMLYDTDTGLGTWGESPKTDSLARATDPAAGWPTFLLRNLLENESFRLDFINRFGDLLNTTFLPSRMVSVINTLQSNIAPEMPEHIARWDQPVDWNGEVQIMRNYVNKRTPYQRQHLCNKFGIPGTFTMTVNVSDPAQGYVRVNTLDLLPTTPGVATNPYPWSGVYFQGIPVALEAVPAAGYEFVGWQEVSGAGSVISYTANTTTTVTRTAVFTVVQQPLQPQLLHYWHFNALPSGTLLTDVAADYTLLGGAVITYPGTGAGYMDRVDPGTTVNAQMDAPAGYGLRARNPANTRELRLTLPTTGYDGIVLRYAAQRSSNGAQEQTLSYRVADSADWVQFGNTVIISETYNLYEFDFTGIAGVANNPDFEVQILFGGSNASGGSGNDRFDNITLEGTPLMTATLQGPFTPGQFYPFGGTLDCGGVTFTSTGSINSLQITLTHNFPTANQDGLPRRYDIKANGSGFIARLQLCYTADDLLAAGIADAANLRARRWNGSGWTAFPGSVDTGAGNVTAENVTQFSTWGLGTSTNHPTAIALYRLDGKATWPYFGVVAGGLALIGWRIRRRRGRTPLE